jgi:hypothetical protein
MADFSGGLFAPGALGNAAYAPSGGDSSGFTMDPSFYGGDQGGTAVAGPGLGQSSVPGALGATIGGLLGGGLGSVVDMPILGATVGAGLGEAAGNWYSGTGGTPGASPVALGLQYGFPKRKCTHLNKSTYVTRGIRDGTGMHVVPKGTKLVTCRRRNAGNARAVRRALGRLAMFDHMARKVEAEMSRVARRHHRPARAAPRARSSHRAGCKCFACRR